MLVIRKSVRFRLRPTQVTCCKTEREKDRKLFTYWYPQKPCGIHCRVNFMSYLRVGVVKVFNTEPSLLQPAKQLHVCYRNSYWLPLHLLVIRTLLNKSLCSARQGISVILTWVKLCMTPVKPRCLTFCDMNKPASATKTPCIYEPRL